MRSITAVALLAIVLTGLSSPASAQGLFGFGFGHRPSARASYVRTQPGGGYVWVDGYRQRLGHYDRGHNGYSLAPRGYFERHHH
jgi:hypothetical protein